MRGDLSTYPHINPLSQSVAKLSASASGTYWQLISLHGTSGRHGALGCWGLLYFSGQWLRHGLSLYFADVGQGAGGDDKRGHIAVSI